MIREKDSSWLTLTDRNNGTVLVNLTTIKAVKADHSTSGSVIHCVMGESHIPIAVSEPTNLIKEALDEWRAELSAIANRFKLIASSASDDPA